MSGKRKRKPVAHKKPIDNPNKDHDSEPESVGPIGNSTNKDNSGSHPYARYGDSIFAILIFVVGMYSGVKFWPSSQSSTDINSTQSVQAHRKMIPPPQPEDFYPVAEFRKQGAILLGCHNQINLIPELYAEIAKAIDQKEWRGRLELNCKPHQYSGRLPMFIMSLNSFSIMVSTHKI